MGQITAEDINRFMREMFGTDADPVEDAGDGWAVARRIQGSEHIRPGGIISGPSVFALADGALAYACSTKIGLEPMAFTSELSIRCLRPAIGSQLRARAEVLSVGRRNVAMSRVDVCRPRATLVACPPRTEARAVRAGVRAARS